MLIHLVAGTCERRKRLRLMRLHSDIPYDPSISRVDVALRGVSALGGLQDRRWHRECAAHAIPSTRGGAGGHGRGRLADDRFRSRRLALNAARQSASLGYRGAAPCYDPNSL